MDTTKQNALFTQLYNTYCQPLYGYLYRLVGNGMHAEELVQDVFTRAYRALPGVAADSNYRAWLYQIATNAARDWFRRQSIRRWLPFYRNVDGDEREIEEPAASDEASLPIEERLAVEEALAKLAPTYRTPLILFAVEGLSTIEIAEILGISRSAVKMRLSRARLQFQSVYGVGEHASKVIAQEHSSLS